MSDSQSHGQSPEQNEPSGSHAKQTMTAIWVAKKQEILYIALLAGLAFVSPYPMEGAGAVYAQGRPQERLPTPWSVERLTGLSKSQRARIQSIREKYHMESTRRQMEALARKYNLPLPGPGGPPPARPDGLAAQRAQLGADIIAGLVDAPRAPQMRGAPPKLKPQDEQARAKMKQLAEQGLANWRSAWHEIEPILTAQQKARLFASQRGGPAPP